MIHSKYWESYAVPFGRYEIHYSKIQNFIPSGITLYSTSKILKDTIQQINGLDENTTYYFKLRIYNSIEKFAESDYYSAKTKNKPLYAVSVNKPVDVTDSTAKIYWSRCKNNDFKKHQIHLDIKENFIPSSKNLAGIVLDKETTFYEIKNLTRNEVYFVKVVTYDSIDLYSVSSEWPFVAAAGGNPVPVTFGTPVVTSNSVSLSWSAPALRYFDFYEVHKSKIKGFTPDALTTGIGSTKDFQYYIQNLDPNTTYYFRIITYTTSLIARYSISKELEVKTLP